MLEIIEYLGKNGKTTRQELIKVFSRHLCDNYLPKLVAEKKLREYRDLSSEEKEVADANERLQESIDELKENNPEDLRIEILQKQFKYIHYHKVYELHYDYLRQLRGIVNHNSNGVDATSKEWREVEYDPTERVRWKIGADIYEYTPDDSFRKNGQIALTKPERIAFAKRFKNVDKSNNLSIAGLDEDIQTEVLQTYQVAKEVQKVRNKGDADLTIEDFINSLE